MHLSQASIKGLYQAEAYLIPDGGSSMLPDYVQAQIQRLMHLREAERTAIQLPAQWDNRSSALRQKLAWSLGLPSLEGRRPVNASQLGSLKRDGYTIRKVVFETYPQCFATSHLYVPDGLEGPVPAVLFTVGHWVENAKMEPAMQAGCIGLAKLGFIVLIYDPLDQGERRGNWRCHNHLESLLVGMSQAGLTIWESRCALDYLQSLPEVDATRLGMTGASGGGLNTLFTSALDPRVKVAVPVCHVNGFQYLLGAMRGWNFAGGQDFCDAIPRILAYADMPDVCALIAPRPLLIVNATRDPMYPTEGARYAANQARPIYQLLDAAEKIRLTLVDSEHGYNQEMREAAYGWFAKWLANRGDGNALGEPVLAAERPRYPVNYLTSTADPAQPAPVADPSASRELYCYPLDQPVSCWKEITDAVSRRAESMRPRREPPKTKAEWEGCAKAWRDSLGDLMGPFPDAPLFTPGILNRTPQLNRCVEHISLETEPGINLPAALHLHVDWERFQPVIVYLTDSGTCTPTPMRTVTALMRLGFAVFTIDLRGTGRVAATEFENAAFAYMLDRDLFAQRLWDIRRGIDYLSQYSAMGVQIDKHHLALIGHGVSGMLALYAGALDPRIAGVGCIDAPVSYKAMIARECVYPASAYVFDVLNRFELAQVASLIAPRPLCVARPLDARARSVPAGEAESAYAWCRSIYHLLAAGPAFRTATRVWGDKTTAIARWLLAAWRRQA